MGSQGAGTGAPHITVDSAQPVAPPGNWRLESFGSIPSHAKVA
jgi:hypothetical protein